MAAFIVISTDNRLHDLVDGIEKCRPQNPCVETFISTGKIIHSESGEYTYSYTVAGEVDNNDEKVSLSDLLSNQFAKFRKVCSISKSEPVNVFLLENPLSKEDFEQEKHWLKEFEKVYGDGQGKDTGFRLFRVLFTYDVNAPTNVCKQMDIHQLQEILDNHRKSVKGIYEGKKMCDQFIFYIDNQNSDAAALCLTQKEHNLKLPRYLADVMMLLSNSQDSYGAINAITNTCSTRCFSVGYAECMYYYPDVLRYFEIADHRNLLCKFLSGEDDTEGDCCLSVMDANQFPFGVRKRTKRLGKLYNDIPFAEDCTKYPNSADYQIDECLVALKQNLISEREKEFDDFENSQSVIDAKDEIESLKALLAGLQITTDESVEKFEKRKAEFKERLGKACLHLDNLRKEFAPQCPEYIDRKSILIKLAVANNEKQANLTEENAKHYWNLVNYVCSEHFFHYIEKECSGKGEPELIQDDTPVVNEKRNGCLGWLFFWKKAVAEDTNDNVPMNSQNEHEETSTDYVSLILKIKKMLDDKESYRCFVKQVNEMENDYEQSKKECSRFTLTSHSNSYCPLIDLGKLQTEQNNTFGERFEKCCKEWHESKNPTKDSLEAMIQKESEDYSKRYLYINWESPFSFVKKMPVNGMLHKVCNKLQTKAAPFVNYNLISTTKEDKVIRKLYTDMPTILDDFKQMKGMLLNGNEIGAYCSSHIESKICMMQFLPMDDEVLDNLVDLQETSASNVVDEVCDSSQAVDDYSQKSISTEEVSSNDDESLKNNTEFWGDH